jgi:hypothetical protein
VLLAQPVPTSPVRLVFSALPAHLQDSLLPPAQPAPTDTTLPLLPASSASLALLVCTRLPTSLFATSALLVILRSLVPLAVLEPVLLATPPHTATPPPLLVSAALAPPAISPLALPLAVAPLVAQFALPTPTRTERFALTVPLLEVPKQPLPLVPSQLLSVAAALLASISTPL